MLPKNLYLSEGTPVGWEGVVTDFVEEQAQLSEKFWEVADGYEYLNPLSDSTVIDEFTPHAQQYSHALWLWAKENIPQDIMNWVLGDDVLPDWPDCPVKERLSYPLKRRIAFDWWSWRGREESTPDSLRRNAYMFVMRIPFFQLASGIRDFEFLEHIVKPQPQRRPRSGPATSLDFHLMQYWMAWSIWHWKVADIPHKLNARVDTVLADSTVRDTIKRLSLRPVAK